MIDLTFGESLAVRKEFVETINGNFAHILRSDLMNLNYMPFEGDPVLIEHTRKVIERQVGKAYKHVVLTNGATGACNIAMRAYKSLGFVDCMLPKPPYFTLYPAMVRASGLYSVSSDKWQDPKETVAMLDWPSNPEGDFNVLSKARAGMPVIWDAVYGNKVYTNFLPVPEHNVVVGSYSKLTGMNGIRIGWLATDDDNLFSKVKDIVGAEYCGLSTPSVMLLNQILPSFNWDLFEKYAHIAMDNNRTEWCKLEKFFGGKPVSPVGMFYYGPMDSQCKRLFEKADILWVPGTKLGHNDDFGRFNIGNSVENIQKAVANVLKADKLR